MELNIVSKNGKMGIAKPHIENMRHFMALEALGFNILTTSGCSINNSQTIFIKDTLSLEPRYNGIKYLVKPGDTLFNIVHAYESDKERVYDYINQIEYENNLSSVLRGGEVISLVGVPKGKLAEFSYTDDYAIIGYDKLLNDANNLLEKEIDEIVETESNKEQVKDFFAKYNKVLPLYEDFLGESDEKTRNKQLDNLVKEFNNLIDEYKELTGFNFVDYHNAYPLPNDYASVSLL